jgi:hypothetical protein
LAGPRRVFGDAHHAIEEQLGAATDLLGLRFEIWQL